MRFSNFFASLAVLPLAAYAEHRYALRNNHNEIARRANGDVLVARQSYSNAPLTYYAVGLGACGIVNQPTDFIVALNAAEYGGGYPGPHCFDMITISCNGKTAQAQIVDECMGCEPNGLDLSQGLFEYFAPTSAGVIYCEWSYNNGNGGGSGDGGGGDTTSTSTHSSTPTSTWQPPSSTWSPPTSSSSTWSSSSKTTSSTSSSSSVWTPSSTYSSSSTSSSSWSSSSTSTSASSSSAVPAPSVAVLETLNQAILGAGVLIAGGVANQ